MLTMATVHIIMSAASDRNDSTYAHAQSEPRGFDACLCSSAVIHDNDCVKIK